MKQKKAKKINKEEPFYTPSRWTVKKKRKKEETLVQQQISVNLLERRTVKKKKKEQRSSRFLLHRFLGVYTMFETSSLHDR